MKLNSSNRNIRPEDYTRARINNQVILSGAETQFKVDSSSADTKEMVVFLEYAAATSGNTIGINDGNSKSIIPATDVYSSIESPLYLVDGIEITGTLHYAKLFYMVFDK